MRTIVILCTIIALGLAPIVSADPIPAKTDTRLDEIGRSAVTGRLGETLGSRMVIDGVLSDRLMPRTLQVSAVNRKTLKQPVSIEIRGEVKLEKDRQYRLEGYESGGFEGPPEWAAGQGGAQRNFAFYSFFIVTKIISR